MHKQLPESYEAWRASVPWTDGEILEALDQALREMTPTAWGRVKRQAMRDHLATTGRLTRRVMREALPYLVKTCGVCGRPALYRYGCHGRCREHREEVPATIRQWQRAVDAEHGTIEHRHDAFDSRARRVDAFKNWRSGRLARKRERS